MTLLTTITPELEGGINGTYGTKFGLSIYGVSFVLKMQLFQILTIFEVTLHTANMVLSWILQTSKDISRELSSFSFSRILRLNSARTLQPSD